MAEILFVKERCPCAAGGIENVMEMTLDLEYNLKVEVEVENAHDAEVAAKCGADIIMLDNRTPEEAKELYGLIKSIDPNILVEVSGRVTLDNVADYATCADRISLLTQYRINCHRYPGSESMK